MGYRANPSIEQAYQEYCALIERCKQAEREVRRAVKARDHEASVLATIEVSRLEQDLLNSYRRLTDLVMADLKGSNNFENWVMGSQHQRLHSVFRQDNVSYHFPVWFYQQGAECGCFAVYGLKALVNKFIPAKSEITQDPNLIAGSGLANWLTPEALNEVLEKTMGLKRDLSAQQSPSATYSYANDEAGNNKILLIGSPAMVIKQWGQVQFNNPAQPLPTDFPHDYTSHRTAPYLREYIATQKERRDNCHAWHGQKNSLENKTAIAIINTHTSGEDGHWVAVMWKRRRNGGLRIICLDSSQKAQLSGNIDPGLLDVLRQLGDILVP